MLILTPFIDDRAQRSVVSFMESEPARVSPGIPSQGVSLPPSLIVNLVSQTGHGAPGSRFRFSPGVRDREARETSLTQPGQVPLEPERELHLAAPLTQHGRLATSGHQTVSRDTPCSDRTLPEAKV